MFLIYPHEHRLFVAACDHRTPSRLLIRMDITKASLKRLSWYDTYMRVLCQNLKDSPRQHLILCTNKIGGRISQIQHGASLTANDINLTPNVTINSIQLTLLGFPLQLSTLNKCNKCYYDNHVLVVTMYGLWHRSLHVFLQEFDFPLVSLSEWIMKHEATSVVSS